MTTEKRLPSDDQDQLKRSSKQASPYYDGMRRAEKEVEQEYRKDISET